MKNLSDSISNEDVDVLKGFAKEAEEKGMLCNEQLEVIYKNKWFNLFVPKEYGGLELSLGEGLRIEEALAFLDGSLGWTVTLCAGANWFIGFLQPDAAHEIFSAKHACLAGSGRPSGTAKMVAEGFEVSGYWKYATGAPHATIFTANCILEKDGKVLNDENGDPKIASFWLKKEEVTIDYNWQMMGMKATASESFSVEKRIVPQNRLFRIEPSAVILPGIIYRYPFLQFAEATLAVNMSGMAMHFIDLCELLFEDRYKWMDTKSATALKAKFTDCKSAIETFRKNFYDIMGKSWSELLQFESVTEDNLKAVTSSSRALAVNARLLTEELYPYCGLATADPDTEINRVWRDMHTASQHPLFSASI